MATSGTHNFNLSLDTVIQEAYERLGDSAKGGYDPVSYTHLTLPTKA